MFLKYFECSTYFRVSLLYYFFSFNYFNMLRHRPSSLKSITPLVPNGTVPFLGKIHEVPCVKSDSQFVHKKSIIGENNGCQPAEWK